MIHASSLADLATGYAGDLNAHLQGAFEIHLTAAAELCMGERAWSEADAVLRAPRAAVERQQLIITRDVQLATEALLNPLRARRTSASSRSRSVPLAASMDGAARTCSWCDPSAWHVSRSDLATDVFGASYAAAGRVRAGPNWARQAPVSGVVFGDQEMHDLLELSCADFRALFEAADLYVKKAAAAMPDV